jgi:hypothetical protein
MIKVSADTVYRQGPFAVGPIATLIHRERNDYPEGNIFFLPAKTIWSAGGVIQYDASQRATLRARAERLWIVEDERPSAVAAFVIPEIRTDAWLLSVAGIFRL